MCVCVCVLGGEGTAERWWVSSSRGWGVLMFMCAFLAFGSLSSLEVCVSVGVGVCVTRGVDCLVSGDS